MKVLIYSFWMFAFLFSSANASAATRPIITTQPKATTLQAGQGLYLYSKVSNSNGVTYQWYKNGIPVAGGATTLPDGKVQYYYFVQSAKEADSGTYSVTFRNSAGSRKSQNASVQVMSPTPKQNLPIITSQPQANTPRITASSVQVNLNTDYLYIYFSASSSSAMTYKWYRNGVVVSTSDNVWINPVRSTDMGEYYVTVSNAAGSVTSQKVTVSAAQTQVPTPQISLPVITSQPQGNTPRITATSVQLQTGVDYLYIFFSATSSTTMTYQWYRNGVAITTNESVWINPAQSSDLGEYYVQVKNAGGSVTSNKVIVTALNTQAPAPAPTPTPTPTPTSLILGGCGSCDGGPQGITNMQNFASFMNKPIGYVLAWGWAPTAHDFEYSIEYLNNLWPLNYDVHFDVPMIIQGTTFNQVTAGQFDSSYIKVAKTIASRNPNSYIRIGHEQNGNWYDWSQDGPAGTSAEFILAWRHIINVMRTVSPNFKFVWNPGLGMWAGIDAIKTYPGDAYVDVISIDMYEDSRYTSGTKAQRWQHFLEFDGRGLNFYADFAAQHGKPLAFDEWASDIDDGMLIENMHAWMSTHNVIYQMYWNSNAAFPGSFATNPYNGSVYKRLFGN